MMQKEIKENFLFIFFLFMVGSFIGFVHENLLTLIKGHYQLRQGLIYEPLIPIYGFGLLFFYLLYNKIDFHNQKQSKKILILFSLGFIAGGTVEYLCSYIQEKIFGTTSWDYSYLIFNLNGRTSLFHASCWGIIGVLFYELLLPLLKKGKMMIAYPWMKQFMIILIVILLLDISISFMACSRQTERRKGIPPSNQIEKWLDQKYPDYYLNKIYNNAKVK